MNDLYHFFKSRSTTGVLLSSNRREKLQYCHNLQHCLKTAAIPKRNPRDSVFKYLILVAQCGLLWQADSKTIAGLSNQYYTDCFGLEELRPAVQYNTIAVYFTPACLPYDRSIHPLDHGFFPKVVLGACMFTISQR